MRVHFPTYKDLFLPRMNFPPTCTHPCTYKPPVLICFPAWCFITVNFLLRRPSSNFPFIVTWCLASSLFSEGVTGTTGCFCRKSDQLHHCPFKTSHWWRALKTRKMLFLVFLTPKLWCNGAMWGCAPCPRTQDRMKCKPSWLGIKPTSHLTYFSQNIHFFKGPLR